MTIAEEGERLIELGDSLEESGRAMYYLSVKWVKDIQEEAEKDPIFKEIFETPSRTVFWLNNGTLEQRLFAWSVLHYLPWRKKDVLKEASLKWMDDPDDQIAGTALLGVGECFEDSKDFTITRYLLKIIRNTTFSVLRRDLAHRALLSVFGLFKSTPYPTAEETNDLEKALGQPFVRMLEIMYF